MIWEKFKTMFHPSWHSKIRPFIESEECNKIYAFLKSESKKGKQIAPQSIHLWRCFLETSLDNLKVVMVGMAPYHTFKNDLPVADGLLMGCSITNQLQPTLQKFYSGLEKELYDGLNLSYIINTDVSYLAKQGVLMLNASLSVEINKAESHLDVWEPFIKYLFEEILNVTGVPIIFLGKDSAKYKKYAGTICPTFTLPHPASASYKGTDWNTEGVFSKVDELLEESNGFGIQWLDIDIPF